MNPLDSLPDSMKLAADRGSATLTLSGVLDVMGMEKLMADLAVLRANMLPQVPREPSVAHSVQEDADMTLQLMPDLGFRIGLRNQGFGWLIFTIPQGRGIAVRDYLVANTPDQAQPTVSNLNASGMRPQ